MMRFISIARAIKASRKGSEDVVVANSELWASSSGDREKVRQGSMYDFGKIDRMICDDKIDEIG